jgi:protein-L-isoaspartate O-methyltransferase
LTELTDIELAARFGDYASFASDASPTAVETYGEDPRQEMKRLLGFHIKPDSCILDLGCGAGQTVCHFAPMVAEAWGFDEEPLLLNRARRRVQELALTNVTLLEGNVSVPNEVAQLPGHHFDVIYSERGPDITEALMATLKTGGIFLQELVGGFDGYHLPELLGRRPFTAYAYRNQESHRLAHAAELKLRPISIKELF